MSVFLLLGTNQVPEETKREDFLREASARIEEVAGKIVKKSAVYETVAVGPPAPDYLNQVLNIHTSLSPHALLRACLHIEQTLGRERREKWAPRPIDIDILYYADKIICSNSLAIPHPRLHKRRFALVPMEEVAPYFIHPVLKKTQKALLRVSLKSQRVKKYSVQ